MSTPYTTPTIHEPATPLGWMDKANCTTTDPDAFFPEGGHPPNGALKVCAECPVRSLCLQWALDNGERWGVLGGMTANQRARLVNGTGSPKATHGTNSMYNRGCHGDDCPATPTCREAHDKAQRAWARRTKEAGAA